MNAAKPNKNKLNNKQNQNCLNRAKYDLNKI